MGQTHFVTQALDPGLLSTQFRVQTRWVVLTGAACCGKTTLVEELAARGYATMTECARQYFELEVARGRTIPEIRADGAELQRGIVRMQQHCEQELPPNVLTFLDRGIPDSVTFFRVFGLDPNDILADCFAHRYAAVFVLDRLPNRRNQTLGPEDETASDFLNAWLFRDYAALGYPVVRVPVLPPQARAEYLLEQVSQKINLTAGR